MVWYVDTHYCVVMGNVLICIFKSRDATFSRTKCFSYFTTWGSSKVVS